MPSCMTCGRWFSEEDNYCGCVNETITMSRKDLNQILDLVNSLDKCSHITGVLMEYGTIYMIRNIPQFDGKNRNSHTVIMNKTKQLQEDLKKFQPRR